MKAIGVTGGVGSGKSALLSYIEAHYPCEVIRADELARELEEPGRMCHAPLVALFGEDIADGDGRIRKDVMADRMFRDGELLRKVNDIVHPAVIAQIIRLIQTAEREGKLPLLFVESALLFESRIYKIFDEIWYVYADEEVRRERLKSGRGYSDEKINSILNRQLSDREFREKSDVVIDNSRSLPESVAQIKNRLDICLIACGYTPPTQRADGTDAL